jgi:hypothetical protein
MKKEMAKKSKNEVIIKTKQGISVSCQKVGLFGEAHNVNLWIMLGCSLQVTV